MSIYRLLFLLATLMTTVPATAADGIFVSVGVPNVSIDGGFDGDSIFSGGGSSEITPKFDAGNGITLAAGLIQEGLMFGISYTQAELDGSWRGFDASGDYWALTGELAYLFRSTARLRPYLLGGVGFSGVSVDDGSTDGTRFRDAKFGTGAQWRAGGGLLFGVSERFNLDLQAVKLIGDYDKLDGIADGSLKDFGSDGSIVTFSVQYVFGEGNQK